MQTSTSMQTIYDEIDKQINMVLRGGDTPHRIFVPIDVARKLHSQAMHNMRNPYANQGDGVMVMTYQSHCGQLQIVPSKDHNNIMVEGYWDALAEQELLLDE